MVYKLDIYMPQILCSSIESFFFCKIKKRLEDGSKVKTRETERNQQLKGTYDE